MLVKEYFPVSVVVPTILEIYQELLGVEFVEIKDGVKLWHPGMTVALFSMSTLAYVSFVKTSSFSLCGRRMHKATRTSLGIPTWISSPAVRLPNKFIFIDPGSQGHHRGQVLARSGLADHLRLS